MSRFQVSLPPAYFEKLYADNPDPWRFATSDYERDKYAATLKALPRERYISALEVGCSIGVLTHRLATQCDTLLALDLAATALDQARERCAALSNVRFEQRCIPAQWPEGQFDLILLSEVVYYLDRDDIGELVSRVEASVMPAFDIILVHWLGETHYPLSGDEAADCFIARASGFARIRHQERTDKYRLDVLGA